MSKNYFELDTEAKKALDDKHKDKRPENFASTKSVEETTTVETTAAASQAEETE